MSRWLDAAVAATGRRGQHAAATRVRAMLAGDASAEDLFQEALALSAAVPAPLDKARTHLSYGRWLRRAKRRRPARIELTTAWELFEAAGATTFADRARDELSPSTTRLAAAATGQLTAHEWRIAYAAAQGRTGREIAEQIVLSVRTVDHHLGNVYRKLGVRSRRDLIRRLGDDPATLAG